MDALRGDASAQPARFLPVAAAAMDLASGIIRDRLPAVIRSQRERDMVSDVDVEIERQVRRYLQEQTPELGFRGESEGSSAVGRSGLAWMLDPVGGLANFVKGIPLYAISLALVSGDDPVLGVIDVPADGSRYSASLGHGAFCGAERIRIRRTEELRAATVTVCDIPAGERMARRDQPGGPDKAGGPDQPGGPDPALGRELMLAAVEELAGQALRVRMLGSAAIELAWLAHGRTDAAVILAARPSGIAAGVILVREAGGIVIDAIGARHALTSSAAIAAPARLAGQVLAALPAARPDQREFDLSGAVPQTRPGARYRRLPTICL